MDIHPPHGPVRNVREFLIHLLIVTLGILIALSLEGLIEWRHHRHLVAEARSTIRHEVADNKTELDGALAKVPEVLKSQEAELRVVEEEIQHHNAGVHNLNLTFGVVELRDSSWETARSTAAISYMDYAEVQRYSAVYALQRRLDSLQNEMLSSFILSVPPQDISHASSQELLGMKERILRAMAYLRVSESIAHSLSQQYAEVLKAKD